MAFMHIATTQDVWYRVEGRYESFLLPSSVCGDLGLAKGEEADTDSPNWEELKASVDAYTDGKPQSIECIGKQWGARYSAPGYMDCTEWVLADSEEDAVAECEAMYGDEEEDEEEGEGSEEDAEPTEPQEGDILWGYTGDIYCEGKFVGKAGEYDDGIALVRKWAEANNYFPNLWLDNGGGNWVVHSY